MRRITFERIVFTTIVIAMFCVAVGLNAKAVEASEMEEAYISRVLNEAVEAYNDEDYDAYALGMEEVYATTQDPDTSNFCKAYADGVLVATTIGEHLEYYPGSLTFQSLYDMILPQLEPLQAECQNAQ
jgi:hypothetical protein